VLEQIENDRKLPGWITRFGYIDLAALLLLGASVFALEHF